ncbi:MAG: hypothetical protein WA809_07165 [Candidatus Dormiibacterota bacterium]
MAQLAVAVKVTGVPCCTVDGSAVRLTPPHVPGAETTTEVVASVSGTPPGTELAQIKIP